MTTDGWATAEEAAQAAKEWDITILECRTYGHSWRSQTTVFVKRYRYYKATQICTRCETVRHQELSQAGIVYASWYTYMDGYLSSGIGRIAGDAKGQLRVATLNRGEVVMKTSAKEDRPAALSTRRALGVEE